MLTITSCKFCASRCGMVLRIEENRVIGVDGDSSHPVSHGWTCARGRAATSGEYNKKPGPVKPLLGFIRR